MQQLEHMQHESEADSRVELEVQKIREQTRP